MSLVQVSFSYKRHIPFMLYTAKIFSLGSIFCLKVLKEIKGKIIKIASVILTTTTLLIRNETMQKELGLLINLCLKEG